MQNFFNDSVLKFIEACNQFDVRMMLVGGVAVNYYGYKRHSADIDFWIDPDPANMENLLRAFQALGYEIKEWPEEVLNAKQNISVKISPDLELELLTKFNPGILFTEAFKKSEKVELAGHEMYRWNVIAFDDLINSKIQSPHEKDKLDLQVLQKIRKQK